MKLNNNSTFIFLQSFFCIASSKGKKMYLNLLLFLDRVFQKIMHKVLRSVMQSFSTKENIINEKDPITKSGILVLGER